jgi:PAS domain S-box-containing protein
MILDIKTLMVIYVIINVIGALAIGIIWRENRKRFAGLSFWLADMLLQAIGGLLIILRGLVPDFVSIVIANTMVQTGIILILMGLERFTGKKGWHIHNYILLAVFIIVFIYYTNIQPSLWAREITLSAMIIILAFQCCWLLLKRVSPALRQATRLTGIVFASYGIVNIARIILQLAFPPQNNDFFKSGAIDSLSITLYIVLSISLTIALILMVGRRLQGEVQSQEEKFRAAFHSSPYAITITRPSDGKIVEVNDGFIKITGYQYDEVIGKSTVDLNLWAREEDRKTVVNTLLTGGNLTDAEYHFRIKSGEIITGLFSAEMITASDGKLIVSSINNITKRKLLEQQLMQEKMRIEATLQSSGDGIITTDVEARITLLNRVAQQLTGWTQEEAIGKPISEIFNVIDERTRKPILNPVNDVINTSRVVGLANHAVLVSRDGTERVIADSGAPIRDDSGTMFGVVLIFRDITHIQKMEEEAQKMAKLESVGTLAGGIAHDFNNILTGILGNISLALMEKQVTDNITILLKEAEKASLRAATLTKQLLTFAKGGAPIRKPVVLSTIIEDTATLTIRGSGVNCRLSLTPDLWTVEADEGQISQIITNMVLNAQQAMSNGGTIEVRTENIHMSKDQSLGNKIPVKEGNYIKISISDHGSGIPAEYMDKIFDPYFTTKAKGSGLGLATSHSIVHKHDGYISVESAIGKGSTFYIYLPACDGQIPAADRK